MTSHLPHDPQATRERHVHTRDGAPVPGELLYRVGLLEEVIVGHLDGAVMPTPHVTVTYNVPPMAAKLYRLVGGRRYPRILTSAAQEDLD